MIVLDSCNSWFCIIRTSFCWFHVISNLLLIMQNRQWFAENAKRFSGFADFTMWAVDDMKSEASFVNLAIWASIQTMQTVSRHFTLCLYVWNLRNGWTEPNIVWSQWLVDMSRLSCFVLTERDGNPSFKWSPFQICIVHSYFLMSVLDRFAFVVFLFKCVHFDSGALLTWQDARQKPLPIHGEVWKWKVFRDIRYQVWLSDYIVLPNYNCVVWCQSGTGQTLYYSSPHRNLNNRPPYWVMCDQKPILGIQRKAFVEESSGKT